MQVGTSLSPTVETAFFRITQEAINNARKHAQTMKILVQLKKDVPYVTLKIQDWGCGFDVTNIGEEKEHLGIIGMQERTALLGGNFVIDSRLGQGTVVRADILINPSA